MYISVSPQLLSLPSVNERMSYSPVDSFSQHHVLTIYCLDLSKQLSLHRIASSMRVLALPFQVYKGHECIVILLSGFSYICMIFFLSFPHLLAPPLHFPPLLFLLLTQTLVAALTILSLLSVHSKPILPPLLTYSPLLLFCHTSHPLQPDIPSSMCCLVDYQLWPADSTYHLYSWCGRGSCYGSKLSLEVFEHFL